MLWKLGLGLGLWLLVFTYDFQGGFGVSGEPRYGHDDSLMPGKPSANADLDNEVSRDTALDKRVERYMYGLGRRAYTFTNGGNGMKRLPVYNFGLGKRAQPYSFGLGKRRSGDSDNLPDYVQDDPLTAEDLERLYNNVYIIGEFFRNQ